MNFLVVLLLAGVVATTAFLVRKLTRPITKLDVANAPSFGFLAARILVGMFYKQTASRKVNVPRIEISTLPFKLSPHGFHEFCHLCQYEGENHTLSANAESLGKACYLEVVVLPMEVILLGDPKFPLKGLAMIHLKNEVIQYGPIPDEQIVVRGYLEGQRITDKGIEIDMIFTAVGQKSPTPFWKCIITLLSRLPQKSERKVPEVSADKKIPSSRYSTSWQLPGNMGLKYAKLSNDYNPQHLYPLTAKLFGFHKPIAHGMYTLSKALGDVAHSNLLTLKYPLQTTVEFKRPIFLPSKKLNTIVESIPKQASSEERSSASGLIPDESDVKDNDAISFAVESENHEPHLKGKIVVLPPTTA